MGPGSTPSQGTKIPETARHHQKKKEEVVWKTLMFLFALEGSFLTTERNICPLMKTNPMQGVPGIDWSVWVGDLYFEVAGLRAKLLQ